MHAHTNDPQRDDNSDFMTTELEAKRQWLIKLTKGAIEMPNGGTPELNALEAEGLAYCGIGEINGGYKAIYTLTKAGLRELARLDRAAYN